MIEYIDINKRKDQEQSLMKAVSHTSKPPLLDVICEGEACIMDKLQDHPDHVFL